MRSCEIAGWGSVLPSRTVRFGESVRYRIEDDVSHLDMLASAALRAVDHAGLTTDDIDLVLGASAAGCSRSRARRRSCGSASPRLVMRPPST
jgi:3-oxoacyl-[acyl-carrier-protein] synthase-3